MRDVVKKETMTSTRALLVNDPLQHFVDTIDPQFIVGELIRFSKGEYLVGQAGDPLANGKHFIASPEDALIGLVKWCDRKRVEQRMFPLGNIHQIPVRSDLGDNDKSQWERDTHGHPQDPWQRELILPMVDTDGAPYTLKSSSDGGIKAVAKLTRAFLAGRAKHPGKLPLVAFKVDSYQHRHHGRIKTPKFEIVGWVPRAVFDAAMAAAGFVVHEAAASENAANGSTPVGGDDPEDDMPF